VNFQKHFKAMVVLGCLFVCSLTLGETVVPSPTSEYNSAYTQLTKGGIPSAEWPYIRYLACWTTPPEQRPELLRTILFWSNSLSFRRDLAYPVVFGEGENGELVQIAYNAKAWAKPPEGEERDPLLALQATTQEAQLKKMRFIRLDLRSYGWTPEIWEAATVRDPYFRSTTYGEGDSILTRGWIDPRFVEYTKTYALTEKLVVRADWWLVNASLEKPYGSYSDWLGFGPKEADMYAKVGVNEEFIEKNNLYRGGAVVDSGVSLHNRGIELLPTLTGGDVTFLWRTYDILDDPVIPADTGERSVLVKFRDELKYDAREGIGTLPNGLHWYFLSNKDGTIVPEAPAGVAQDHADPHDARVFTAYKCVLCHGPAKGIIPFENTVEQLIVNKDVGLAVYDKDPENLQALKEELEDYYLSPLSDSLKTHQEHYQKSLYAVNGRESLTNSKIYVDTINDYKWGKVTIAQAAVEWGVPEKECLQFIKDSGRPEMLVFFTQKVASRAAFEGVFDKMMTSRIYPWENTYGPTRPTDIRVDPAAVSDSEAVSGDVR
jgi:hypothetical protein